MPHKADGPACDTLTADATAARVVNTVVRRDDGTTWGDSTDGEGLVVGRADPDGWISYSRRYDASAESAGGGEGGSVSSALAAV
jgi:hypothetical protein